MLRDNGNTEKTKHSREMATGFLFSCLPGGIMQELDALVVRGKVSPYDFVQLLLRLHLLPNCAPVVSISLLQRYLPEGRIRVEKRAFSLLCRLSTK